jgi:hypothetical protein
MDLFSTDLGIWPSLRISVGLNPPNPLGTPLCLTWKCTGQGCDWTYAYGCQNVDVSGVLLKATLGRTGKVVVWGREGLLKVGHRGSAEGGP